MNLRKPRIEDYTLVYSALSDWPLTDRGPTTLDKAIGWTRRWINRSDEHCLIGEEGGTPVGLIAFRGDQEEIEIDYIAVHPDHRGNGHAREIMRELHRMMVARGVRKATFEALPGPITDMVERGRFRKRGEKMGQRSGLPLVEGEVTADMEI